MKTVVFTDHFKRLYKKSGPKTQQDFDESYCLFCLDIYNPTLKTHKLSGRWKGHWAFSINRSDRVIFRFSEDKKNIYFKSIGDHKIYGK